MPDNHFEALNYQFVVRTDEKTGHCIVRSSGDGPFDPDEYYAYKKLREASYVFTRVVESLVKSGFDITGGPINEALKDAAKSISNLYAFNEDGSKNESH